MEPSHRPHLDSSRRSFGQVVNKKVGCLVTLLTFVVAAVVWVHYPPAAYSAEEQAVLDQFRQREKAEQAVPKTPEADGYLDPVFLPYWGRKGIEEGANQVKPVVMAFSFFCDQMQGSDVLLEASIQKKDPKLWKAVADYAALYRAFQAALDKPHFVVPLDRPRGYDTIVPNFLSYRGLAGTNSGYAHYLCLTGKTDQALGVVDDTLRFCRKIDGPADGLLSSMISLACKFKAQSAGLVVLTLYKTPPSQQALQHFIDTLSQTQSSDSDFLRSAENDYALIADFMTAVREGRVPPEEVTFGPGLASKFPGVLSRELSILNHDYFSVLKELKAGREPDLSWMDNVGAADWLLGRHSVASSMLVPNFSRARQQHRLGVEKQAFLHLYASLLLDAEKQGRWPATLSELKTHGYTPLPGLELEKLKYTVTGNSMELVWDHPNNELLQSHEAPTAGMEKWKVLDQPTWRVQHSLASGVSTKLTSPVPKR